ncbi:hypothetical protein Taro_039323 [Colocasia esculenta]|uniref:Uncharacterized protein n=1 Tax=Colocasia esculenta TaxID=4460 RepID=A0A843WAD9_COLES|nr:hypothetical protein [Colocasia esculenta]
MRTGSHRHPRQHTRTHRELTSHLCHRLQCINLPCFPSVHHHHHPAGRSHCHRRARLHPASLHHHHQFRTKRSPSDISIFFCGWITVPQQTATVRVNHLGVLRRHAAVRSASASIGSIVSYWGQNKEEGKLSKACDTGS